MSSTHIDPSELGEAYELAYEEAKRALDEQERTVNETRSRAGQLIAAAAITTSFFGSNAITSHHVHTAAWFAIGCFIGLSLSVLSILWPRDDWQFSLSPANFIATYVEPADVSPLGLPMIYRDLALHMGNSIENNRRQLRWVFAAFRVGVLLLTGEVVAWVIALVHHG